MHLAKTTRLSDALLVDVWLKDGLQRLSPTSTTSVSAAFHSQLSPQWSPRLLQSGMSFSLGPSQPLQSIPRPPSRPSLLTTQSGSPKSRITTPSMPSRESR
ncbi:MAG: hypothetical protein [Circoviridae sp.]|nr:MAG: hypothetical protein [Circoviridae sp.]